MKSLNVGVVGATGIVGETFLQLIEERRFPINDLRLFASHSSKGKEINYQGRGISLQVLEEGCFDGLDLVFFSSGNDISEEWAPKAVQAGAFAIDNAVIIGKRQIHHRSDGDLIVNNDRTFFNPVHAENAGLRQVEDRRRQE